MSKKLSQEVRDLIMESSKWNSIGLVPTKKVEEVIEESTEEVEEEVEEEEVLEEDAKSRCPLCVSELDTPLDQDAILEHLDIVLALVDRISESSDDEELDMDALINEVFDTLHESDESESEEDEDEDEDDK